MELDVGNLTGRGILKPAEVLIDIRNVSKDYVSGESVVRALRDVDLRILQGEFVAIVGTSGSGKSTLMNILGCLDRPTRGTYELAGVDAGHRTNDGRAIVRNRLIGFIFQGFNLLPRTTALENCELPLQYRGVAAGERRKRAMASLAQVGLEDRVHHTPNQLSGGQQQRVAIARALVTDPPLLLADEPTGNLDTRTSLEVLALLQKLNRTNGITIVLVTHEHDIAACASRVITVRDGKIVSDVRQDAPLDAAAELVALPPVNNGPSVLDVESHDPAALAKARLGGPVPFMVFFMMWLAGLGGALIGLVYNALILGTHAPLIVAASSLVAGSWAGARYGMRRTGRPLTMDQRVRLALWLTLPEEMVVLGIAVLALTFRWGKLKGDQVDAFAPLTLLLVVIASVIALALLRYLLLTLFTPSTASRAAARAAKAA